MKAKTSLINLLIASALGGIFLLSYLLIPDARGYGTHEHLYLPPCYFKFFLHIPCPACGLTTSFAYLAKGNLLAAWHTHWMSPFLFVLFLLLFVYSIVCLFRGKTFWDLFEYKWMPAFSSFVILSMLLCWVLKLFHNDSHSFAVRSFF